MSGGVALVASPGGHVDEAFEIAERFAGRGGRFWITARTLQTQALLEEERVEWVPEVKSREAVRAIRSLGIARRIMRGYRPHLVVSTGSALTVPYMAAARSLRIPVTYVESATRMDAPSLTGRIAEWLPKTDRRYQSTGWNRRGWRPFGSIFDGYSAVPVSARQVGQVLVTIGSEKYPFHRALHAVRDGTEGIEVTWQTGNTPVAGAALAGEVRAWWPGDELAARARASDVVVTHAGVGSILMVLRSGSCPVVIPRTKSLGEHVDDHQMELARMLDERGVVVVARPGDDIAECIDRAAERRIVRRSSASLDSL